MSTVVALQRARAWGRRHLYSLLSSLGGLLRHWAATLMTVLVLGIAMALPLGLGVVMQNLHGMDLRQDEWGSMSVFLRPAAGAATGTWRRAGKPRAWASKWRSR